MNKIVTYFKEEIMKGLKKLTSIVLAVVMVVTLCAVNPTAADAAVKFYYGKKLNLTVGQKDEIIVKGKEKYGFYM